MTAVAPSHTYSLAKVAKDIYSSKDSTGGDCIIFVVNELGAVGRRYQGIELRFATKCTVKKQGKSSQVDVGILHCRDATYEKQFQAVKAAIIDKLKGDPGALKTADGVVAFVESFACAFQPVREKMGRNRELGLWGELQALLMMPKIDRGVDAWQGPNKYLIDYSRNGVEIEVKASSRGHLHRIKHEQTLSPWSPQTDRVLLSFSVVLDHAGGTTVRELADQAFAGAKNKLALEAKLAEYGFEATPATPYSRWTVVGSKAVPQAAIPKLPPLPDEIGEVDYTLDVTGLPLLTESKLNALFRKLTA